MIRTIITGGNGFIGKRLVERFPYAVHLEHGDIGKWKQPAEQFFFLSTYGNMAHHTHHGKMVKANVHDLLTVSYQTFYGWFCYMSSSSVTLAVQTPYSRTKRAAEEILQSLPELKSCIVRPYSCIGVGEQKEHLIPTLIRSCMEGEEMPFDPEPVHDFIDVSDVVDGLIALSEREATGIFEFGSGISIKNEQVKEIVEAACGRKANVKTVGRLRPYDSGEWYCKTQNEFFTHKKTIFKSITEMVEAYREKS